MGLKKKIVKSLIVWPPLVVAVGSFLILASVLNARTDLRGTRRDVAITIFGAACSVGNVVYIVKS
jgi:hypothetical protein